MDDKKPQDEGFGRNPMKEISEGKIEEIMSSEDIQRSIFRFMRGRHSKARELRLAHRHFTPKAKARKKARRKMARKSKQINARRNKGK